MLSNQICNNTTQSEPFYICQDVYNILFYLFPQMYKNRNNIVERFIDLKRFPLQMYSVTGKYQIKAGKGTMEAFS